MADKYFFKSNDNIESWEQLNFRFEDRQTNYISIVENTDEYNIPEFDEEDNYTSLKVVKPLNNHLLEDKNIYNSEYQFTDSKISESQFLNLNKTYSSSFNLTFSKKYYLIGEVSEMLNISASNIRFWESQISILKPQKHKNGIRYFTSYDVRIIYLVLIFIKRKKWTIQKCNEFFKKNLSYLKTYYQYLEKLIHTRNQLADSVINF